MESRVDVLINNAGVAMSSFQLTTDGHETTWHANHLGILKHQMLNHITYQLGPVLLTQLLLPLIEMSDEGRIVVVSSDAHSLASSQIEEL